MFRSLAIVCLVAASLAVSQQALAALKHPPLGTYLNNTGDAGPRTITFNARGRYTEDVGPFHRIRGRWTSTRSRITFTEIKGGACTGITATYKWRLRTNALRFTVVSEKCVDRRGDLPVGSWKRKRLPSPM